MRENCLSYNEILGYFGEHKISDRYKFLYDKMMEYIRVRGLEEKVMVHEGILQQTVMDYFVDIYRMKEFHKVERVGMSTILAYETFWILRRKPIQFRTGVTDDKLVFVNEGFVTTLLAHEFLVPATNGNLCQEDEEKLLLFLRQMNYHFKYHVLDKQQLECMLMAYRIGRMI